MHPETDHRNRRLPLSSVRVANFGWIWAAPVLGHLMADMGAEVTKIESEARVDMMRRSGITLRDVPNQPFNFHNIHRSGQSITVDLARPEAVELTLRFLQTCDVVVENYRPGTMERFGLGYQDIRRVRPDIIMVSLSAAGQTGPLKNITTFGSSLGSLTGLDSLQGYYDNRPIPAGMVLADPYNGVSALFAVLTALRHRRETGQGQLIDISQWEATTCTAGAPLLDWQMNRRLEGTRGNRDPAWAPHNVYPARGEDRWIAIAVRTEEEWRAFRRVLGNPAWARGPRFGDAYRRLRNQDDLDRRIARWTESRDNMEMTRRLQEAGVAAFPAMSLDELFHDRHFRERGSWTEVSHPFGVETVYGIHWKLSETPGRVRRAAPLMGQENDRIFGELLGIPEDELRRLESEKVIY